MSVFGGISENRRDNIKKTTDGAGKLRMQKEEFNISKSKMQNSELGIDREIVQGKKNL